jgi:hypothetical protein
VGSKSQTKGKPPSLTIFFLLLTTHTERVLCCPLSGNLPSIVERRVKRAGGKSSEGSDRAVGCLLCTAAGYGGSANQPGQSFGLHLQFELRYLRLRWFLRELQCHGAKLQGSAHCMHADQQSNALHLPHGEENQCNAQRRQPREIGGRLRRVPPTSAIVLQQMRSKLGHFAWLRRSRSGSFSPAPREH